jgi:hypothetical protein
MFRFKYLLVVIFCFLTIQSLFSREIPSNRTLEVLHKADRRSILKEAGKRLGDNGVYLGGAWITGERLVRLADKERDLPILRVAREEFGFALDLDDFLYFIDDVLAEAEREGVYRSVFVTNGRGRSKGILIHPDDIFGESPHVYGRTYAYIDVSTPKPQSAVKPAKNGEFLGPRWTRRYRNTSGEKNILKELSLKSPDKTFAKRVALLVKQLRAQGADVSVYSGLRKRQRGYLMWGSFALSRCKSKKEADALVKELNGLNKSAGLNIAICWAYKGDWKKTVARAKDMAETYDVVYATKRGAFHSDHYDGLAVDFTVRNLPATLTLTGVDGETKVFDLSDPHETRDLSLSPELISWVEKHFMIEKLRSDYPHWSTEKAEVN